MQVKEKSHVPSAKWQPKTEEELGLVVSGTMGKKTVYLIRHAESELNRRVNALCEVGRSMRRISLPSRQHVSASMQLIAISRQVDTAVSVKGEAKIRRMAEKLTSEGLATTLELIVHSPLLRAKMTCMEGLGVSATNQHDMGSGQRVVSLDILQERLLSEWVGPKGKDKLGKRIALFETWLEEQPEETVAVVGHSQYFKEMLLLDFKFGNCDVWKLVFDPNSDSEASELSTVDGRSYRLPPQWTGLELIHAGSELP